MTVTTTCEGYVWVGQDWCWCDECGWPYWKHTQERFVTKPWRLIDSDEASRMYGKYRPAPQGLEECECGYWRTTTDRGECRGCGQ